MSQQVKYYLFLGTQLFFIFALHYFYPNTLSIGAYFLGIFLLFIAFDLKTKKIQGYGVFAGTCMLFLIDFSISVVTNFSYPEERLKSKEIVSFKIENNAIYEIKKTHTPRYRLNYYPDKKTTPINCSPPAKITYREFTSGWISGNVIYALKCKNFQLTIEQQVKTLNTSLHSYLIFLGCFFALLVLFPLTIVYFNREKIQ